jgi:replicative DNA helicase
MDEKKRFEDLTPEEQAETLKAYQELTDNKSDLEDLQAEIDARRQGYGEVWRTGFSELDKKLDGGLMGEQLIFLGAISSLGKTSFALQIATQVAEQGKDVLIFSLEMSKNELNAKTISRYTHLLTEGDQYRQKYRLTTRDILSGRVGGIAFGQATDEQGKLFIEALEATQKLSSNTRIYVGENDVDVDMVRDIVDTHIEATGKRPFVILDYLQILQPSELAKTADKRLLTDYDVTRLKVLSRDAHVPVLVISAFNRTSYLEPVSMGSFRESSGIEYSSDILLAMQYDGMDYQKHWFTTQTGKKKKVFESSQDHNTRVRELLDKMDRDGANGLPLPIELKILKNRNGSKGSLFYDFLPAYNYYAEKTTSSYVYEYDEDDVPFDINNLELPERKGSLGKV